MYTNMYNISIMSNTIPISEARKKLPEIVDRADTLTQKTYITVRGKIKAALVNARELELLEETLEIMSDPKLADAIKQGEEDIKKGRLISLEDVKKELGL